MISKDSYSDLVFTIKNRNIFWGFFFFFLLTTDKLTLPFRLPHIRFIHDTMTNRVQKYCKKESSCLRAVFARSLILNIKHNPFECRSLPVAWGRFIEICFLYFFSFKKKTFPSKLHEKLTQQHPVWWNENENENKNGYAWLSLTGTGGKKD